jgi:acyl-CoA thioester hydrolase
MNYFKYRVYYEDTDAMGVVYYANYLKFYERARTDFLRINDLNQTDLLHKENLVFVVKNCDVAFISPAKLDDELTISVELKNLSFTTLKIYQEIKKSSKILSTMNIDIVGVDAKTFKPKKINNNLKLKEIFNV